MLPHKSWIHPEGCVPCSCFAVSFFRWRYLTIVRPWRRAMDRILRGLVVVVVVVVPPLVGMAMDVVFGLLYYTARSNSPAMWSSLAKGSPPGITSVVVVVVVVVAVDEGECGGTEVLGSCRRRCSYSGYKVVLVCLGIDTIQTVWFSSMRARNCVLTSCTCLRVSAISRRHA